MTDREKLQKIFEQVEGLKETNPASYYLWTQIFSKVKPEIDQLLEASEEQNTKVHTGGE